MKKVLKAGCGPALLAALMLWAALLSCDTGGLPESGEITWTAKVDGAADTATSTVIVFTFSDAVDSLTAADITLEDDTGSAAKGALIGGGTAWSLAISVAQPGDVKVGVNRDGIDAGTQTVKVHKAAAIAWTATTDGEHGAADSTVITFSFDAAVTGLTAGHIALVNDTGALVRGALAGEGRTWTLGIAVQTAGTVKVRINRPGIEETEKTVTVFTAGEQTLITYTALADGSNTAGSTVIAFTFDTGVTGLTVEDISLVNDTGAAAKGALSGEGNTWSLGITVQTAGTVKVRINKPGIEGTEKTVTLYKAPPLPPLAAALEFASEEYSSGTTFESSQWTGQGTAQEGWVLSTTAEQNNTWFAVYKEAAQTITVGGTDGARVSQAAQGDFVSEATQGGLTASRTFSVFKVKTGDLVFHGGTRSFALNVSEPGALPRTVSISLNVTTNHTGAAMFKLAERDENGVEYLTRLDTGLGAFQKFLDAFTWVETYAQADTEYTIRVEKNESLLPHLVVGLQEAENVSLRLEGTREGPWRLEPNDVTGSLSITTVNISSLGSNQVFIQIGGGRSGFMGTYYPKRTFILGNNIIIKSGTITSGNSRCTSLMSVNANATLVMKPGSEITGHNAEGYVIMLNAANNTNPAVPDPLKNSHVRIEGGAITNCTTRDSLLIRGFITAKYLTPGLLCLAGGNALTLSGNNNGVNKVEVGSVVDLDVVNGMILPAE